MSDFQPLAFHLVGAPGSGKSAIAAGFRERSQDVLKELNIAPLTLVDTAPEVMKEYGLPLGLDGTYFTTMSIFHYRADEVLTLLTERRSAISCGTAIDNLAHINVRGNILSLIQSAENEQMLVREVAAAQMIGTYFTDRVVPWHFIWYVPLGPQVVVPGKPESTFNGDIDAMIRHLNVRLGVNLPVLDGTVDEKVDQMIESVKTNYTRPE